MKRKLIVSCVILLLLFWFSHVPFFVSFISKSASLITLPFLSTQKRIRSFFSFKALEKRSLQANYSLIKHLRDQNKKLLADNIALRGQMLTAKAIEDLLPFKKNYADPHAILAQVLLKNFSDREHSFIVDRGSIHGVQKDMVVVWHNCLIGKVTEIFPFYSKVILVTDLNCKIAAQGELSESAGIIEGIQDIRFLSLSYVDHLKNVVVGEQIFSSGQGIIFPRGFLIGTIKVVRPGKLYHAIGVQLACNLTEVEYCYLTLKGAG